MRAIAVRWYDAKMFSNAWTEETDLKVPLCLTVGIVHEETDRQISIVQNVAEGEYSNLIAIPRGCICTIIELGEIDE